MKGLRLFFSGVFFLAALPLAAERISFSAGSMTGKTNSSSTVTLKNNAFVQTESMEISADAIELSGDDYRMIRAQGGIKGKNLETKMSFTCDFLDYDRETKIAVLKGGVTLVDEENEVTAKAQLIEYNQNLEIAVLQIDINLTQEKNVCSGSYAVYYKTEQLLELSGNAQVKQDEDVFRAQQIRLDMNTQDIFLDGNVKGVVKESKPDAPEPKAEQKPEPAPEPQETVPGEDGKEEPHGDA